MSSRPSALLAALASTLGGCVVDDGGPESSLDTGEQTGIVTPSPAGARAVPADYDGDGYIDLALKGDNGQWYIDIGRCSFPLPETIVPYQPPAQPPCDNNLDDDGDGLVNDGCGRIGPTGDSNCDDLQDQDRDGKVNDGCPHCNGHDAFGGRWDFVYDGYGDSTAVPVPADYGVTGGGIDPLRRVDLAIKTHGGMWAIDYADNGFGRFDIVLWGYGNASAVPVPADYDGDGRADLAVKTSDGWWLIDYAFDGFGAWNDPNRSCWENGTGCGQVLNTFGNASWTPVPADYNGDGRADLAVTAVESNNSRRWKIDYSNLGNSGFNGVFQVSRSGYGPAGTTPVPFNYDPLTDNRADIAVKDASGNWYIDYAAGGFLGWNTPCPTPTTCSSSPRPGYGGSWSHAVPGDYDFDGIVDLSVKDTSGTWYVDLGHNGWNGWDSFPGGPIWIDNPARPIVDTTKPYIQSTRIYGEGGYEVTSLTVGVRYTVDVLVKRGTGTDNAVGVEVNPLYDAPTSIALVARTGSTYSDDITDGGMSSETHRRYAITCREPGNFPLAFQLRNAPAYMTWSRVFNPDYGIRVSCVAPAQTGLSGRVTQRVRDFDDLKYGVFKQGDGIWPATVEVRAADGSQVDVVETDYSGYWHIPLPQPEQGPFKVTVNATGYSRTIAVNVTVPPSGLQLDTPMTRPFPMLPAGTTYTSYLDYSRGRTLLHTLAINPAGTRVRVFDSPFTTVYTSEQGADCSDNEDDDGDVIVNDGCPTVSTMAEVGYQCENAIADGTDDMVVNDGCPQCIGPAFDFLWENGDARGATAIMNGTWWSLCNGSAVNYVWLNGPVPVEVRCDNRGNPTPGCLDSNVSYAEGGQPGGPPDGDHSDELYGPGLAPMFTINGTGTDQTFDIVASEADFLNPASLQWRQDPFPIWDPSYPWDGISDVDYAIQIANPPLLVDNKVIGPGDFRHDSAQNYDYAFARTSVGVGPGGVVYWVIADGENVHGGNGATANQLAHFYRDVLGATKAMGLDSGLSTEMLIRTSGGLYRVNTITGEDSKIQINPYLEVLPENEGAVGTIGYFMTLGP